MKKRMPGWNQFVRDDKNSCLKWHNIWKEAGSPSEGVLADIRKTTRAKYHKSIEYIKKHKDNILKNDIASSLQNKKFSDFWNEIRKLKSQIWVFLVWLTIE